MLTMLGRHHFSRFFRSSLLVSVLFSANLLQAQEFGYLFSGVQYATLGEAEGAAMTEFDADLVWLFDEDGDNLTYAYASGYTYYNGNQVNCFAPRNTSGPRFDTIAETISATIATSAANCESSPLFCSAFLNISATGSPGPGSSFVPVTYTRSTFAHDCGGASGTSSDPDSLFAQTVQFPITRVEIPEPEPEMPEPDPQQCEAETPNPIDTFNGHKFYSQMDYRGAGAFPLDLTRHYNSLGNAAGAGPNWRHTYNRSLNAFFSTSVPDPAETPSFLTLQRATGKIELYVENNGIYEPADGSRSSVERLSVSHPLTPGFRAVTARNEIEIYNLDGKLLQISSPAGLSHFLNYDAVDEDLLISVSDDFGKILNFSYDGSAENVLLGFTDPDGNAYSYTYDANSMLVSVTYPDLTPDNNADNPSIDYFYDDPNFSTALTSVQDENGDLYIRYEYDISGRAILSEFGVGVGSTNVSYDEVSNTRTITNSLGLDTVLQLDATGYVTGTDREASASGLCPAASQFSTYNASGFKTSSTDWNGNVTNFQYNSRGLVTSKTEAIGTAVERAFTIAWHSEFRLPTEIAGPGKTTTFFYDNLGSLLTRTETDTTTQMIPYSTNGGTRTWTFTYYPESVSGQFLIATQDGPRTDVSDATTFTYTAEGFVETITNSLGHVTQVTSYNSRGLPLSIVDGNSVASQMTYHPRGWLLSTRVIDPTAAGSDANTTNEYDDAGQLTKITLPDGTFLSFEYDAAHRLIAIVNNLNERKEFTLDDAGNITIDRSRSSVGSITWTQERIYDELSRIYQVIGGANQIRQFGFDDNGNQISMSLDPLGINQSTLQSFDALDRVSIINDANNNNSSFQYDARDNLISVTDQRGLITTYVYDGLNNLIQQSSPDTGITVFTYDDAGNQLSQIDARGVVTNKAYDSSNRLILVSYPSSPAEDIAYAYDQPFGVFGVGRLTQLSDQTGASNYVYDHRGNQIESAVTIQSNSYSTQYAYDLADNLIQTTYPSGRVVANQLDSLGRTATITTMSNVGGPVQSIASNLDYLPFGPMTALDYGNNLTLSISNDLDYRVASIDIEDIAATNPAVLGLTYTQNAVDNITAIADSVDVNESQTFIYDLLNRLQDADGDYGDQAYSYDPVGNRLSLTTIKDGATTVENYTYDTNSNRLLSVDKDGIVRTLQYDDNGNIVSDDRGAEDGFTLEYNDQNRLIDAIPAGVQP